MTEQLLVSLMQECIFVLIKIAGPLVLTSLVVGLIISILQATTQIQEQTLVFVPKLIAIIVVLIVLGPYFMNELTYLIERIHEYMVLIS